MLLKFVSRGPALAGLLLAMLNCLSKASASAMVPDADKVILAIGQNEESLDGYTNAIGSVPGGIMSYTSTAAAEGLTSLINYGSGNICAQNFIGNPAYTNTVLQLGVYIDGDLANIVSGLRDGNIAAIGNWVKNAGRPVYLRIGYEFDGPWNALDPNQYIAAYRYIVNAMRANNVTNAVYVWHSACASTYNGYPISAWYPGDDYVDWAGISVYQQFDGTLGTVSDIDNFCAFAKSRNKPVMIAESTPYGGISDARWANWFLPCLDLIHRQHIQMWCYIDANWEAEPMFAGQGWGDCRIEQDAFVMSNWLATISSPAFLNQCRDLYPRIHANATNCWSAAGAAELEGTSAFSDAAASAGIAVSGLSAPGASVTFTNGGTAQEFVLRYSAANFGTLGLYINSQPRRTLPIAATGGSFNDMLVHAPIPAGALVKIQFDAGDVPANLDSILFRGYEDSDGDGLPDDWERWRFGSLNYGPNDDPDGDGNSNYAEWVADTDPMNKASALQFNALTSGSETSMLAISPSATRTCFIEQSTDLRNWVVLPQTVQTNAPLVSAMIGNPSGGNAFYRLVVP